MMPAPSRPLLNRLLYADRTVRVALLQHGVNLVPVHFYRNTPSIEEIEKSYEYTGGVPYANGDLFRDDVMHDTLERLIPFAAEFSPPGEGDEKDCQALLLAFQYRGSGPQHQAADGD